MTTRTQIGPGVKFREATTTVEAPRDLRAEAQDAVLYWARKLGAFWPQLEAQMPNILKQYQAHEIRAAIDTLVLLRIRPPRGHSVGHERYKVFFRVLRGMRRAR